MMPTIELTRNVDTVAFTVKLCSRGSINKKCVECAEASVIF